MFWGNKGNKGKGKEPKEPAKPVEKPRSISSFFAKAPPKPADDGDGDAEQPAKRARVAESPAAAAAEEPMSVDDSPPPPPRALAPLPIPPTDAARHAHFAERLSLGVQTRNGAQRDVLVGVPFSSYGRDAGPAGPYTPLEKQVVALKRANPGILLMVEARCCSFCRQTLSERLVCGVVCGAQVGYKYRFFGDDATAASGVLNIFAFADRNFLVAGGPTHRGALYVRRLVEAGHKVGVVRQSETAALKAAGEGRSKLFERKLTAVYTRATIAAGVALDGGDALGDAPRVSSYLVALAEAAGSGGSTQLALVAVETSTGDVACGAFRDGPLRAALESHLLTLEPGEVLLVGALGAPTEKLVAGLCGGGAARVERAPSPEALLHGAALAELTELCAAEPGADAAAQTEAEAHVHALMALPELLCVALAAAAKHLASFGLARVLRRAAAFRPLDSAATMTLPPNALRQLDVLAPAGGAQGAQGSLLWLLNHARTPMGKRAVQRWVARPLRSRDAIDERLGAVAALLAADDARDASGGDAASSPLAALGPALAKLPDLERCLTRALHRTATPGEFVTGLSALAEASTRLAPAADDDAEPLPADARLLRRLLGAAGDPAVAAAARALVARLDAAAAAARPPDLARLFVATADHHDPDAAGGSGDTPHHGTGFPAVDAARAQIATAEASLAEQLPGLRRELRLPRLEYVRVSEVDYLLEVPDGVPVPSGWLKHSTLKSRKLSRWHAPAVTRLVEALQRGRESLDVAARAAWDAYLASFAEAYAPLRAAADALAQLDALRALATLSRNPGYVRPTLLPDDAAPRMHVVAGRHPMLDALLDGAFVPNDTHLASDGVHCACLRYGYRSLHVC
jgi:DNA mismatch repair protein MSH3